MSMKTIRRIAAYVLNVGTTRVKINDQKRALEALTREDVRGLIKEGVIEARPMVGVGRGKAKFKQSRKNAGRRRNEGSRKGASGDIRKRMWIANVRAQRELLSKTKPKLVEGAYQKLYAMIKGGYFRSKAHFLTYVEEKKLLKAN